MANERLRIPCSGCFTCHRDPTVVIKVDEPPERLKTEADIVRRRQPSLSEDFWTNTTIDMDNSAAQSQGSVSSISTINQTSDSQTSTSPAEFVNHGLLLWNQTRQNWVANKKPDNPAPKVWEPKLNTHCLSVVKKFMLCSWNASYESLLGSNKPFPQPIPLSEMVDFLVEVWEQEGMYD
ncbi:hypothetical protein ACFE04_031686 [Oxalis oulophora]